MEASSAIDAAMASPPSQQTVRPQTMDGVPPLSSAISKLLQTMSFKESDPLRFKKTHSRTQTQVMLAPVVNPNSDQNL